MPGNGEEDPSVVGGGDQEGRRAGEEGAADDDVRSAAQDDAGVPAGFIHLPQRVGERAGGVDHRRTAGHPFGGAYPVTDPHPPDRTPRFHESRHLGVVERHAPQVGGGADEGPTQAGVVELAVVKEYAAPETTVVQSRYALQAPAPRQKAGTAQPPPQRQRVVGPEPGAIPGPFPPPVCRNDQGERTDEVRRVPLQQLPLAEGAVHHLHPALPQVANPAMDQLGAAARRPPGEVAALEEERPVTARRRVQGGRDSRASPAHHDDVPGAHLHRALEDAVPGQGRVFQRVRTPFPLIRAPGNPGWLSPPRPRLSPQSAATLPTKARTRSWLFSTITVPGASLATRSGIVPNRMRCEKLSPEAPTITAS